MARDDGRETTADHDAERFAEAVQAVRDRFKGDDGFDTATFDALIGFYDALTKHCPTEDGRAAVLAAHRVLLDAMYDYRIGVMKKIVVAAQGGVQ